MIFRPGKPITYITAGRIGISAVVMLSATHVFDLLVLRVNLACPVMKTLLQSWVLWYIGMHGRQTVGEF